ncbi:MAG: hypothetical protein OEZ39_14560 [Gammaproteobacteria bacterium]|nr:hypothetical protein [Gammaproteobacteria bacterium]MDH5653075.1 hypothetical protein [Gammaproteobacteria bacterium]
MFENLHKPRIGKLRIRSPIRDAPALRLGLSNILNRVDLGMEGMNPSEILVIKKFSDPAPGKLPVSLQSKQSVMDWERAVQSRIRQLRRLAVHPQAGFIPADCQSVVFHNSAELVACLSLDLSRGQTGHHWWWDLLLKHIPIYIPQHQVLHAVFSESIAVLPAVLAQLHDWHVTDSVLGRIEPQVAQGLCYAMAGTYGLHVLADVINGASRFDDTDGTGMRQGSAPDKQYKSNRTAAHTFAATHTGHTETTDEPPSAGLFWYNVLGTVPMRSTFGRERVFLLGLGLLLAHKPWQAAGHEFQQAFAHAWHHADDTMSDNSVPTTSVASRADKSVPPILASPATAATDKHATPVITDINKPALKNTGTESVSTVLESHAGGQEMPELMKSSAEKSVEISEQGKKAAEAVQDPGQQDREQIQLDGVVSDETVIPQTDISKQTDTTLHAQDDVAVSSAQVLPNTGYGNAFITTEIGGVLYLLNLMKRLDLPACFEQDWQLFSRIGPWAVLEILGRALLNDRFNLYRNDPLWGLLAQLDGRAPGEPPGGQDTAQEDFRLPADWFHSLSRERETYRWSERNGRLKLWSASGMLLVDVSCNDDAFHQAERELQPYLMPDQPILFVKSSPDRAPAGINAANHCFGLSTSLCFWLSSVLPAIRYSLAQALGEQTPDAILLLRARIYASSSHIDLVTGMENISLAVRCSGLDRDPGWMPELGKVVLFHYE